MDFPKGPRLSCGNPPGVRIFMDEKRETDFYIRKGGHRLPEKICKTIHQYSKGPIPGTDMQKLMEIAEDYKKVKNYIYGRYGGIASLSKIYPGYTVQNEMTRSGLRAELAMPSVYFYLAVFDALGDIKSQWTRTKSTLLKRIAVNQNLTEEEKHYLRFLLKVNNALDAVLNEKPMKLPKEIQARSDELSIGVDAKKMYRYLRRQVRKCHVKEHTDKATGFSVAERAYRYADAGIYISTKEKRKRVFVPLTDRNQYRSQLYVRLYPEESRLEIKVPVKVAVHKFAEYSEQVGVALGIYTMLTTDRGSHYGKELGKYQTEYAEWMREQTGKYNRNKADNPGRKKYNAQKRRLQEQMHSYINQELNRFLRAEKPGTIYLVKFPKPQPGGRNKKINHSMTLWQRGYIRKRLMQKCRERSVETVEVLGKDISHECSNCGVRGIKSEGKFYCSACGYSEEEKTNTARNVKKRGQGEGILYRSSEQPFR